MLHLGTYAWEYGVCKNALMVQYTFRDNLISFLYLKKKIENAMQNANESSYKGKHFETSFTAVVFLALI